MNSLTITAMMDAFACNESYSNMLEISHIGDVTKGKVDSCLTCRLKEMENVSNFMWTEIWKM